MGTRDTPHQVKFGFTTTQAVRETSAIIWPGSGESRTPVVILAHSAGSTMTNAHLRRHATDLASSGYPSAVFNFPYAEVGRKRPDPPKRLLEAWHDAITVLHDELGGDRPLVIGGRSMGGRMASLLAADPDSPIPALVGVACLAYPLHPVGRPEKLRVTHWPNLTVPVLFINGDRDVMAPPATMAQNVEKHMPPGLATVVVIPGADHSMRTRKKDDRDEDDVLREIAAATTRWLATL